jgi:hypothetical protein
MTTTTKPSLAAASGEDHLPLPPGLHPPVWQNWGDTPHEAQIRYLCTGMAVAERTLGRLPVPEDYEPEDSTGESGQ